VNKLGTN